MVDKALEQELENGAQLNQRREVEDGVELKLLQDMRQQREDASKVCTAIAYRTHRVSIYTSP